MRRCPMSGASPTWGWRNAIGRDPGLAQGLNVHAGQVTHEAVASALGLEYHRLT